VLLCLCFVCAFFCVRFVYVFSGVALENSMDCIVHVVTKSWT